MGLRVIDVIKDLVELIKVSIKRPPQKSLNLSKFGLNCFFNQPTLGKIEDQAKDIDNMDIKLVRVLFNWNDGVQPSINSPLNLGFYDDIVNKVPVHFRLLVVLNGAPNWLAANKDPQEQFLNYIKKIVERFKGNPKIWGYQIGNETNQDTYENNLYGFADPTQYVSLLHDANALIKLIDKHKMVTNAATTSIIQDFDNTIRYNRILLASHIEEHIDAFSFHYYGDSYLNFYRPSGAYRLLKNVKKPLLLTEFGSDEPSKHLEYAREKFPYLLKKFPNIVAGFWYQYDGGGTTTTYGLRPANTDLYQYLKSN